MNGSNVFHFPAFDDFSLDFRRNPTFQRPKNQDGVKLSEIQQLDRLREPDEMADQLMLDAGM